MPRPGGCPSVLQLGVRQEKQHRLLRRDDDTLLAAYSQRCLPRVWRAQEFSHWMLSIMNPPRPGHLDAEFLQRLQMARLERLRTSRAAAAASPRIKSDPT
jgi:p-hydroxybenzoate 3-monooxygenase